ncbi:MAG: hypothetical protein K6A74_04260 [Lachnospiraceae bacterium]|nr:hypothetical protein [Lachnospiraceae bacterium]
MENKDEERKMSNNRARFAIGYFFICLFSAIATVLIILSILIFRFDNLVLNKEYAKAAGILMRYERIPFCRNKVDLIQKKMKPNRVIEVGDRLYILNRDGEIEVYEGITKIATITDCNSIALRGIEGGFVGYSIEKNHTIRVFGETEEDIEKVIESLNNVRFIDGSYSRIVACDSQSVCDYDSHSSVFERQLAKQQDVADAVCCNQFSAVLKYDGTLEYYDHEQFSDLKRTRDWKGIVSIDCSSDGTLAALKSDGTVVTAGRTIYSGNVSEWRNVIGISVASTYDKRGICIEYIMAVTSDGNVMVAGDIPDAIKDKISEWQNIVSVYAGSEVAVGFAENGVVKLLWFNK